uniref:Transposase (Putative), gypsy type n=1 Tax=Tanacetum cinerariifolium TaxID=118510 RepID=A0A6L2JNQ3_TANCI|nr:hypothetical protein [Tanacetum cinerariifolium]GEU38718.1 hypothetical protein [Tanacetum cinerariifolium]
MSIYFVGKWCVTANGMWPLRSRFSANRETWMGLRPPLDPFGLCVRGRYLGRSFVVSGLEPCAFFLATHFLTDVTFRQAVSHFEIMCRVLGHQPSLGSFPLDSLKGWNDHFFWIDASVCPIFVPWCNDVSVKKDPLPSDDIVWACSILLSPRICHSRVPLLTETADVVVNPSPQMIRLVTHTYTILDEINIHSGKNKRKVGASVGPPATKKARTGGVSINEPNATTIGKSLAVIQKLINQANVDSEAAASRAEEFVSSSVMLTPECDYEDDFVSNHDYNVRTCPPFCRYVVLSSSSADTDILTSPQVVPPIPYVQTNAGIMAAEPVAEPVDGTHGSSILKTEVGGLSIPKNETWTSSAAPGQGSPVDDFYDSQTIDSTTAQNIYVYNGDVTNNARMDDPVMCKSLVDYVPLPRYWASLHNLSDTDFLDRVNLNSAQHVCMVFELRICYEHEITIRQKFKKKFTDSSEVIQQRDAEIVELRSKLEKAEGKVADVLKLRRRVSELEATATAKAEELAGLSVQNAELSRQVSGLESVRDGLKGKVVELKSECICLRSQVEGEAKLKERFVAMKDAKIQRLVYRGSALDARLFELSYQTALGKVVSLATDQGIPQGLEARIDHGKASIDLGMVEAYDLEVKAWYEEAVGELKNISLPFLHRLESYKDAPLDHVMASLYLEGFRSADDETLDFRKL